MTIFPTFRYLKNFSCRRGNDRVPFREVKIFGRFLAWESVFSLPAKRPALKFPKWPFFPMFRHLKSFLATGGTAGFPFARWPFLDVSELEKAFSRFQWNSRLTVHEMTIFLGHFLTWKKFCSPPAKRPGFSSRSNHFLTFRSLRERFFASGETAGLSITNDSFFPTCWKKIFLATGETPGFLFAKWLFLDVSQLEKAFSRFRRNGLLTVPEMSIFSDVSGPEKP